MLLYNIVYAVDYGSLGFAASEMKVIVGQIEKVQPKTKQSSRELFIIYNN